MRTNIVGKKINSIRSILGLTQASFCRAFNSRAPRNVKICQSTLSRYENGKSMPSAIKFKIIQTMLADGKKP